MHSLEAVNLSKTYGHFSALDDLNLNIEGAKCVGFLGPNGAGKSTTLKIFTDLIRPSRGAAMINGVDVHKDKKKALEKVSALIETPEVYPSLTARQALSFIAELRRMTGEIRKEKIEEAMSAVKMTEWLDKKVGKFSKGMKQRVVLASTLLNEPEIMILDEPTSGLDPRGMSEVRDLIKSLKKKGRLILMSSHLLSEVVDVCDEVAIIDHGKLLVYDTIQNATSRFSGNASVVEIGFSHPIEERELEMVSAISGVLSVERLDSRGVLAKIVPSLEVQENLQAELAIKKIGMVSFKPSSSALEDVYLSLVKDTR